VSLPLDDHWNNGIRLWPSHLSLTTEGGGFRDYNKHKERFVSQFQIFIIRAIFGLVIALVITRAFYGWINPAYVAALAFILVGLAYFAEYLRKRRKP